MFERHYAKVALWCLRHCGDRDKARDLAQDIFLKLYKDLDKFDGKSKFSTWLYVVTRNHCYNAGRGQKEKTGIVPVEEMLETRDSGSPSPDAHLFYKASLETARRLLRDELDDTERRVMVMHYGQEMTLDAISRALQLTNTSGAKAYIVSAKRKLTRAIALTNAPKAVAFPEGDVV